MQSAPARNASGTHDFSASDAQFDEITRYFVPPSDEEGFNVVRLAAAPIDEPGLRDGKGL
ncbi:hypothetical protein [Rhizobium sp. WW_1]|uniref:hypothetical protein n=1 Tax=unclassified Rhizobium TaxID=2613769 RepID=UPI000A959A4B